MLLRSRPDTVHRFLLRKTQTSTSLIKGSFTAKQPRFGITPAVADCRYRAPLSPRLRGILTILTFFDFVNLMSFPFYFLNFQSSFKLHCRFPPVMLDYFQEFKGSVTKYWLTEFRYPMFACSFRHCMSMTN